METNTLIDKIKKHWEAGLPFACYSLPEQESLTALFQSTTDLHLLNETDAPVFVMAPFDHGEPSYCLPRENVTQHHSNFEQVAVQSGEQVIDKKGKEKKHYLKLVNEAIEKINRSDCKKIVLSRKKELPLTNFDFKQMVERLLVLYPDAFRYIWYHPATGLWCGASPEVLLVAEDDSFKTMALAGTQKIQNDRMRTWTPKEVMEQKLVTDMISSSLEKITSLLKISKTYTHKAGTIAHIRTDLEGIFKRNKYSALDVAAILHPTPAVCGTPTDKALAFIRSNEPYERSFYTGYVGVHDPEMDRTELFVNLRCMSLENGHASLYVGGGITADSEAFSEYRETQHKLQTMAKVIGPFL